MPSASRKEPVAERAISAVASSGIEIDSLSETRLSTSEICGTLGREKSKR